SGRFGHSEHEIVSRPPAHIARFFPCNSLRISDLSNLIRCGPCLAADQGVSESAVCPAFNRRRVRGNPRDRRNGFSILEVLMVVGISTVVAAIAVPMMRNTIGDFKLSGDARGLTNAVSLAKLRAASD